jgi:hypothetical protein
MIRSLWLRLLSRRLFRTLPRSRRTRPTGRYIKPRLESLEIRVVPTTFEVVGNVTGANQFTTLGAAIQAASSGDTIQIESGSHPGSGIVNQNGLTIQGDPVAGAAGLQTSNSRIDGLLLNGTDDTVTDVFAYKIFLGSSSSNSHISNNIYSPGGGVFSLSGDSGVVGTSAQPAQVTFSASAQTVQLSAKVLDISNLSTIVNEGTVTFTVQDSSGNTVGNPVTSSTVQNGVATANYTVPAGQAAGVYSIVPHYVDSTGTLTDLQDTNSTLTIKSSNANADNVTTTAGDASATFSSADQTVQLSATVTDTTNGGTTVNEGTVLFTVKDSSGNVIGKAVSGGVQGGDATANFTLPGGTAVGTYTINVSYSDSAGNFTDTQDNSGTLTVRSTNSNADNVTTTASDASATFSSADQTVQLNAAVIDTTNGGTLVKEGTILFTVKDSSGNTIGTPVSGMVQNGTAMANFTLPGGTAIGSYTINVSYSDSAGNFTDTQDVSGTLTVHAASGPDSVTTTARPADVVFSSSDQTVHLSAAVTDSTNSGTIVNEGTVTFTVQDAKGNTIGKAVTGTVLNGSTTADFTLPGGTAIGTYTIGVSYSDPAGKFTDTQDVSAALTVSSSVGNGPDHVTTSANSLTLTFSTASQPIQLTASVLDTSNSNTIVNEGTVTFTVKDAKGNTVGSQATSLTVSSGAAIAAYTLPAGQAPGTYTISVHYTDSAGNFTDTQDNNGTLTVRSSTASDNVSVAANAATATFSASSQPVQLTATVKDTTNSSTVVNEGTVTFTVKDAKGNIIGAEATSLTVQNGVATATYTLPAGQAVGTYAIFVHYTDSANKFTDTQDTSNTLTVQPTNTTADNVTTTAKPVTAFFSVVDRTVELSADVKDTTHTDTIVNEGTVNFTVVDASGNQIGNTVTGTVSNGTASADFAIPGNTSASPYGIRVSYTDSKGNFTDAHDTPAQLTLNPANVNTSADNGVTIGYNLSDQTITITGTLTNASHADDPIAAGMATIGVADGNGNVIGSLVDVPINNTKEGPIHVSTTYTIPAGTPGGTYGIIVGFKDSSGNYAWNIFHPNLLTINSAASSVILASATVTPEFGTPFVIETLTAQVGGPFGAITEGRVFFNLDGQTFVANVDGNGDATITIQLPLLAAAGPQGVQLDYADTTANFVHSQNLQTIQWNPSDVLPTGSGGIATFNADGSQAVQTLSFGSALFTIAYDAAGRIGFLDFGGVFNLSFSYNGLGELTQISLDGVPVLFLLYTPQGQLMGVI